ncbi:MAG TPA: hypothetical protein VGL20_08810 [Candidatus Dormibacteraeota bacterium]|jgi:hypothetical protein
MTGSEGALILPAGVPPGLASPRVRGPLAQAAMSEMDRPAARLRVRLL